MVLPQMPEGYWLKQEGHRWYVWKEDRPLLRCLLFDSEDEMMFYNPNDASIYAFKHKAAGLSYNEEVPSYE